jgi:hypothetical protein
VLGSPVNIFTDSGAPGALKNLQVALPSKSQARTLNRKFNILELIAPSFGTGCSLFGDRLLHILELAAPYLGSGCSTFWNSDVPYLGTIYSIFMNLLLHVTVDWLVSSLLGNLLYI